jgi:translation initiation factor 2B subunit (eIF-2B alpha/beta/delta family)
MAENKKSKFNKICRDIKSIKIQGATNIAKAAINAYNLLPNENSKKKLLSLRPTEPLLSHVIELSDKLPKRDILSHFKIAQDKINENVYKLIKDNSIIFTHCHSTNVVRSLIFSKKKKKRFEVYNTETRPLYQGRKTAKELKKYRINVTMFIDSAIKIALTKDQDKEEKTKPVDLVLLGADALLKNGIINKVGSGLIAEIAGKNKIPLYIVADSWKYHNKNIKLEQRDFHEVWGTKKIHIKNPAFEFVDKSYITGIITELGVMKYEKFIKTIF